MYSWLHLKYLPYNQIYNILMFLKQELQLKYFIYVT